MSDKILHLLQNFFSSMALTSEDILNLIFSLLLAFLIAIVISQVYRFTRRGVNFEIPFMMSLTLLAPIVALVMIFIRGNLVLSLGLVGSLSIIRFRTPIKDTRDMVFLFWSIAVGLGAGTFNWGIVTLASIFMVVVIFILHLVKYGSSQSKDYILVLSGSSEFSRDAIMNAIHEFTQESKLRSQKISDEIWEMVFELRFSESKDPGDGLIDAVKAIQGIDHVSLLAPQLALPV
jgi:uncharacterized membrane protein YhiD involved in acid resistance